MLRLFQNNLFYTGFVLAMDKCLFEKLDKTFYVLEIEFLKNIYLGFLIWRFSYSLSYTDLVSKQLNNFKNLLQTVKPLLIA